MQAGGEETETARPNADMDCDGQPWFAGRIPRKECDGTLLGPGKLIFSTSMLGQTALHSSFRGAVL